MESTSAPLPTKSRIAAPVSATWSEDSRALSADSKGRTLASLLLVSVVGISMAGIGAVHQPVLLGCAMVAIAALALTLCASQTADILVRQATPALVAASLAAYTIFQALPLPMPVLEFLSASSADIWKRALLPTGEGMRAWGSLSLDPGASLIEAVKCMTYGAVFLSLQPFLRLAMELWVRRECTGCTNLALR